MIPSSPSLTSRKLLRALSAAVCIGAIPAARGQTPSFTTLVEFSGTTGTHLGSLPVASLVQGADGLLYGTTRLGGAADYGTVFRVTTGGTFTSLRSFTGTGNAGTPGFYPLGGVYVHTDGSLWGTTGGNDSLPTSTNPGFGTWWKMPTATTFQTNYYFSGRNTAFRGDSPRAGMTLHNGKLYGTTFQGGASDHGTIFSLNISNGALTYLVDFSGNGATNKGSKPSAPLIDGGDGFLYGTTAEGGTGGGPGGFGTIFKYQPDASSITTLVNFTDVGANPGKTPLDTLMKASDGNLYGTTANGGMASAGTIYKLVPSTGVHTVLAEFTGLTGAYQGANPAGRLVQHSNGLLYGTTYDGGAGRFGTVFSITTGGFMVPKLIEFTGKTGNFKGAGPWQGMTRGTDGNLYGTTGFGGSGTEDGFGTIFKMSVPMFSQPVVTAAAATAITGTGAILNGTVNPNGANTNYVFEYGLTTTYTGTSTVASAGVGTSAQNVSAAITGLQNDTLYNYRIRASNNAGVVVSSNMTFTTGGSTPALPAVTTGAATGIVDNGATLNGTVNPNGGATTYQFEYGTTASYGSFAPAAAASAGSGGSDTAVNVTLNGLASGTTYFFSLTASNGAGPVTGSQGAFTTTGTPPEPTLVTGSATSIAGTSAQLNGTVNPRGAPAFWQFEWGFTPAFGNTAPVIAGTTTSANADVPVTSTISGLLPGATIFYRLLAWRTSEASAVYGTNSFFTTPLLPSATAGDAVSISTTGGTLVGTVNPQGRATTWQFEYGEGRFDTAAPAAPGSAGSGSADFPVSFSITGLAPGITIHYRVKAVSSSGTTYSGTKTFTTTLPNVRTWRMQYFGTMDNAGSAHNDADPDADGVKNLLEYAFGMNPTVRDSQFQPIPTWNGSNLIISFAKPSGVSDVTYTGEVSTNLVNWSPIANAGGGNAVTYSAPISTAGRSWMRIRVSLQQ